MLNFIDVKNSNKKVYLSYTHIRLHKNFLFQVLICLFKTKYLQTNYLYHDNTATLHDILETHPNTK